MGNYVDNVVEIKGEKLEVEKVLAFIKNGNLAFDFNKIIPKPYIFNIKPEKVEGNIRNILQFERRRRLSIATASGAKNFGQWSDIYYGCFPPDEVSIMDFGILKFKTWNSPPRIVLLNLSFMFPLVKFRLYYVSEYSGSNSTILSFINGKATVILDTRSHSYESYGFAYFISTGEISWRQSEVFTKGKEILDEIEKNEHEYIEEYHVPSF